MMNKFIQLKVRAYYFKISLKAMTEYLKRKKGKKRVDAYARNTIYRNMMKRVFKRMVGVQHKRGMERIAVEGA